MNSGNIRGSSLEVNNNQNKFERFKNKYVSEYSVQKIFGGTQYNNVAPKITNSQTKLNMTDYNAYTDAYLAPKSGHIRQMSDQSHSQLPENQELKEDPNENITT